MSKPDNTDGAPSGQRPRPSPLLLLIHGTAAGDPNDRGDRWWQEGSVFVGKLELELGDTVSLSHQKVFHWGTGPNSEHRRRQAGEELHKWLLAIEAAGDAYDIVAHSHGGSVVWHAFLESVRTGRPHRGLRSWTTVGTPFLHFRPDSGLIWQSLPLAAAVAATAISYGSARQLIDLWRPAVEAGQGISVAMMAAAAFGMLLLLGFSTIQLARLVFAWIEHRRRQQFSEVAWQTYGAAWRGLYSPEDEAINGLRGTLGLTGAIVPRSTPWGISIASKFASALAAPLRLIYNRAFARLADQFIWDRTSRGLQGNDLSASRLADVTQAPLASISTTPLPAAISHELSALANGAAARTLAAIRSVLAVNAQQPHLPDFTSRAYLALSWNELVHNSYFELSSLRALIADGIATAPASRPVNLKPIPTNHSTSGLDARQAETPPRPAVAHGLSAAMATAMLAMLVLACGTLLALHRSTILPFADEYQIAKALEEAPVVEAVRTAGTDADRVLTPWVTALISRGLWKQVLDVGVQYEDATGFVLSQLLAGGRDDLVRELVRRVSTEQRVSDCAISQAAGLLVESGRLDKVQAVVDILAQRLKKNGLSADRSCFAMVSEIETSHSVDSPKDALDSSRLLLARAAARQGTAVALVSKTLRSIENEQERFKAVQGVIDDYIKRGQPLAAYQVVEAVTYPWLGDKHTQSLATALGAGGHHAEARILTKAVLTKIKKDDTQLLSTWANLLGAAGLGAEAAQIAENLSREEIWVSLSESLVRGGDFARAEEAVSHLPKGQRSFAYAQMSLAAIERKRFDKAEIYCASAQGASDLVREFAKTGQLEAALRCAAQGSMSPSDLVYIALALPTSEQRSTAAKLALSKLKPAKNLEKLEHLPLILDIFAGGSDRGAAAEVAQQLHASVLEAILSPPDSDLEALNQPEALYRSIYSLASHGFIATALESFHAYRNQSKPQEAVFARDMSGELEPLLVKQLALTGRTGDAVEFCRAISATRCEVGKYARHDGSSVQADIERLIRSGQSAQAALLAARAGRMNAAESILSKLPEATRDDAKKEVALSLHELGNHASARTIASLIAAVDHRDAALEEMAENSLRAGDRANARACGLAISDKPLRAKLLLKTMPEGGDLQGDQAIAVARELLKSVPDLEEGEQPWARVAIAELMARHGAIREARLVCETCPSIGKMRVYGAILSYNAPIAQRLAE